LAFGFRVGEGEKTLGREKVIFRFYKRMHWVVCKTQEEEIEREFLSKLERGKRAKRGHISQETLGTNPKRIFVLWVLNFLLLERPYCTDPYSPYNRLGGHKIEAACCTDFEAAISVFSVGEEGSFVVVRTTDILAQISRCWKGKIRTAVRIFWAQKSRQILGQFWCCEVFFSWLEIV
jgi:hypothetical protein